MGRVWQMLAVIALAMLTSLAAPNAAAQAAPVVTDLPIPRVYAANTTERADPDKTAEDIARETAQADAHEAACKSENWDECSNLGHAYHYGQGRPQNRPVAELLYRKACNGGSGAGCFGVGTLLRSIDEEGEVRLASVFLGRACRLRVIDGCAAEIETQTGRTSNDSATQAFGPEQLRADCGRGTQNACYALAELLLDENASPAEQDEGRSLIDRMCRAGEGDACRRAANHWDMLTTSDSQVRMAEYALLGCEAADSRLCSLRGKAELAEGRGAGERAAALAYFDRACSLDPFQCDQAAQLREEPELTLRCDGGDGAACVALGTSLAVKGSPLEDNARALALLTPACNAGVAEVCQTATDLVFRQAHDCATGKSNACDRVVSALASGDRLNEAVSQAAARYAEECSPSRTAFYACSALESLAASYPAAPLMMAQANFGPELTPEEVAEEARLQREEQEREEAERTRQFCTTTSVLFEGVSYADKLCETFVIARIRGLGFTVRRGAAPWQALLWRPESWNGRQYTPQERVYCGGSVIHDGWVLTAAHCLNDKGLDNASILTTGHRIRLGLNNALGDEGFSYPIIAVHRHPDYNPRVLAFDIALVQYDVKRGRRGSNAHSPARIRLDPVPLRGRMIEAIPRVSTYGWGLTKVSNGTVSNQLRGARMKLQDRDACTKETKFRDAKRRDSVLCADELKGAEGGQACDGDSGGPLITYSDPDKVPTLIGVVSGGVECGTEKRPSRYIRIAHPSVQAWLRKVLPSSSSR